MGLREDIRGVLADIDKQIADLRVTGPADAVVELGQVQSQLSCVLIEDEERAMAARLDNEAHEVYVAAKRLVRLAETSGRVVIERALGMIWSAALDDLEDDAKDADGNVVERRGEDAAALMSILRMIERRADPEAWHRQVQEDIEDPEVGVVVCDETLEWLRKHYGAKS